MRVDRLDQQPDLLPRQRVGGIAQILHQHLVQFGRVGVRRRHADQAIDLTAVERRRIVDGAMHAVAEFVDPVRQDRDAALAGAPIAGGKVVQHLRQPVLLQLLAQRRLFEIVGEEIFDPGEARGLGRAQSDRGTASRRIAW